MSILIVGSEGSMGKRYQAILRYLGKAFQCADRDTRLSDTYAWAKEADGIILCTPTDSHRSYVQSFASLKKPILCEKPVTKSVAEIRLLRKDIERHGTPFRMVLQYEMLAPPPDRIGPSRYNYFRHGADGLVWDCLQIIGLARSTVDLREDSPTWACMINGKALNLGHMDAAYIAYIQKWFKEPNQDMGQILAIHEKTAEAAKGFPDGGDHERLHRYTGSVH